MSTLRPTNTLASSIVSALLLSALGGTLGACTIYKSSDRDFFNSNGVAGAPKSQELKPKSFDCQKLESLGSASEESFRIDRSMTDSAELYVTHRTSAQPSALYSCRFGFDASVEDSDLEKQSRPLVERYATVDLGT